MVWEPDQKTKQEIQRMIEADLAYLPEQLGIDQFISGCRVVNVDPYATGVFPRYMSVAFRDEYNMDAWVNADYGLAVDDYVTVVHMRDGNRYEITGIGGSGGGALLVVHTHADGTEGGQLDWDDIWSDAVHSHANAGEGGQLDWDDVWTDAVHDHSAAGEGGQLDWDNVWSDAVHDHSSAAEGGQNLRDILELEVEASTELTIAAGVVTRTQVYHRIDTQGDAATDDLDTINGGVTGDLLIIRPENDARTVVVKHQADNIWLISEDDISLEDTEDHLWLIYDGANWCSVGDGGGGTVVIASGVAFPATPDDGELFIRTDLGADGKGRLYRYSATFGVWYTVSDGRGIERSELHEHAVNEDKTAECDGAKVDFLTANEFEPEATAIYLNGSRQRLNTDYTEAATYDEITMTVAPNGGDEFIFDYILA